MFLFSTISPINITTIAEINHAYMSEPNSLSNII